MSFSIVAMQTQDLAEVLQVQEKAYPPDFLEDIAFFRNRLTLSPHTCWVARGAQSQQMHGYLIAYPWHGGLPPTLNEPLHSLPTDTACWFLHDCAVADDAQGTGIGAALYRTATYHAYQAGFRQAALVALASARFYWERLGFQAVDRTCELETKLAIYGHGACYLTRTLTPQTHA